MIEGNELQRIGIVLVNLGTPTQPSASSVRSFLADFLSDPRVIDLPKWLWWPILYGIVLVLRPKRVAKLYQKIWTPLGSPMRVIGERQAKALNAELRQKYPMYHTRVRLAMRYGEPSIEHVLQEFSREKIQQVYVMPLFPQYSSTTTASVWDAVSQFYKNQKDIPTIIFNHSYASEKKYIEALANSVRNYWSIHGRGDKLVMSFHGIPKRYVESGDPYAVECEATAHGLAKALDLSDNDWVLTYQSRFGYAKWLEPYTDNTLMALGKQGVERVDVISPAFSCDCLETLEELAIANQQLFVSHGGKAFHYIPALNDSQDFIEFLADLLPVNQISKNGNS